MVIFRRGIDGFLGRFDVVFGWRLLLRVPLLLLFLLLLRLVVVLAVRLGLLPVADRRLLFHSTFLGNHYFLIKVLPSRQRFIVGITVGRLLFHLGGGLLD